MCSSIISSSIDRSIPVERLTDGTIRRFVPPEHNVMSVGRVDRQQERVVPDTSSPRCTSMLTLYTSAQRPCTRTTPGRAASEGRQERR